MELSCPGEVPGPGPRVGTTKRVATGSDHSSPLTLRSRSWFDIKSHQAYHTSAAVVHKSGTQLGFILKRRAVMPITIEFGAVGVRSGTPRAPRAALLRPHCPKMNGQRRPILARAVIFVLNTVADGRFFCEASPVIAHPDDTFCSN